MSGAPLSSYEGRYDVVGPPGTGKTTFLRRQVRAFADHARVFKRSPDVLLCSLTRTAASEIIRDREGEAPLPIERWRVGTLHSHAFRALGKPTLAESKEELKAWNERHVSLALGSESSGGDVDDPSFERSYGTGDQLYAAYSLYRARRAPRASWPTTISEFADVWETFKRGRGSMDFSDLIEACVEDVKSAPGDPQIIMADEAQDMSRLELDLFAKWGAKARAIFIVGDPYQALYTWRGADPTIFFDESVADDRRRVLGQSHRIPAKVHRLASKWISGLSRFKEFAYKPREEEGAVSRLACGWRNPDPIVREIERVIGEGRTVGFLAACSYMLEPVVKALRVRGIPFGNPWRPNRGDWNPIREGGGFGAVRAALAPMVETRCWTLGEFWAFAGMLRADSVWAPGSKAAVERWAKEEPNEPMGETEMAMHLVPEAAAFLEETLRDLHEGGGHERLLDWIGKHATGTNYKRLVYPSLVARRVGPEIADVRPKVVVGTFHSLKGGEIDDVLIAPDLSPNGMREWNSSGEGRDSVIRLFYVALTRARNRVILLDSCGPSVRIA